MKQLQDVGTLAGLFYLIGGLFVVFVLIPIGIDEPGNVEFNVLAPAYWPRIICLVLAGMGAAMLVRGWLNRDTLDEDAEGAFAGIIWWRVGLVIAGTFGLYASLDFLGLVLAGAVALVLLMLLAGERRPVLIACVAVGVPMALYVFFTKAAGIPIPSGILEPLLLKI